jgi:transposase
MTKYSHEQRLKAIKDVLENQMSYQAVGNLLGCGKGPVREWVRRYELHGIEGFALKNGTYTGEFKQHVIEYMHDNHLSIAETAPLFNIPSVSTVAKWECIYYEEGPLALHRNNRGRRKKMKFDKPKKVKLNKATEEELIAEVQRLRMENAYLKKLNALVQERIARENGKKQPPSTN